MQITIPFNNLIRYRPNAFEVRKRQINKPLRYCLEDSDSLFYDRNKTRCSSAGKNEKILLKPRFHYERAKEHSLFLLLIFLRLKLKRALSKAKKFNKTKNNLFHACSGNGLLVSLSIQQPFEELTSN